MKKTLTALAVVLLCGAVGIARCQEPADSEAALKPIALISFSGYKALHDDIAHLGKLGGNPQLADMLELGLKIYTRGQGLVGVDKSKPWGAAAVTDGGSFRAFAFVPVKDLDKLLDALIVFVGEPEDEGDGIISVVVQEYPLYIKEQEGWAFIARDPNVLLDLPQDPQSLLEGLEQEYDLAVRAYPQNIPEALRESGVETIAGMIEYGMRERLAGETVEQQQERISQARESVHQMAGVLKEVQGFTLGEIIDRDEKKVRLDFTLTAVPNSGMAAELAAAADAHSRFAGFDREDALLAIGLSHPHFPEGLDGMVADLRQNALEQIKGLSAHTSAGSTEQDTNRLQRIANGVFDLLAVGARSDRLDGGMAIVGDGPYTMIAGRHVGDGPAADKAVRALLESIQGGEGLSQAEFNVAEHQGVTFHRVTASLPKPPDEKPQVAGPARIGEGDGKDAGAEGAAGAGEEPQDAACCANCEQMAAFFREMLGEQIPIVMGTSQDSLYIAVGQDGLESLKRAIDQSAEAGDAKVAALRLHARLGPMIESWADSDPDNLLMASMARVLSQRKQDRVALSVQPVPSGLSFRLEAGEGMLSMLGVMAVIQAMSGGLGGL